MNRILSSFALTPCALALSLWAVGSAHAAPPSSPSARSSPANTQAIEALRQQLDELRRSYDARIQALETRLQQAQQAQQAPPTASAPPAGNPLPLPLPSPSPSPAQDVVAAVAPTPEASGSASNRFNPNVSLILSAGYNGLSKSPDTWQLGGFLPPIGEVGPGPRGFNLGESELTLSANIDHLFYGAITLAVSPEDTISAEEAFVQTTALPAGLKLKAGRFYAGLGYLNEKHAHTWDFIDAPLAYQAFLGRQFKQEGLQARWVLPLDRYVELGLEVGNGHNFPGSTRDRNGSGATLLSAHTGGDVGFSNSWRAGVSWLQTRADGRTWDSINPLDDASPYSNSFSGRSRLWVLDGVWTWAPNGNGKVTNLKLQGEYFRRTEGGLVTFDTNGANSVDRYRSAQSGWYLQSVYQFMPAWRVGLRHDRLDSGSNDFGINGATLALANHNPQRNTLLTEWAPSEYSRWRLQLVSDRSRIGSADRQIFLQYQISLGAHGAHGF